MKIIVDAFGGDNAPKAIIRGAVAAIKEFGVEIILVGDRDKVREVLDDEHLSMANIEIVHSESVIEMDDEPTSVIKSKRNSSLGVACDMLANGEGDALVSAGSTGAVLCGGSMIVKRIPGIKRAALAPIIPSQTGHYMLIDCGANVECKPEFLAQFGLMGSIFMKKVYNIDEPRVGLLNNGTEETKGTDVHVAAYEMMCNQNYNFVGNLEGRDGPAGACDVLVADGFSGNIYLKLTEGMGAFFQSVFNDMFLNTGFGGTIAAMFLMKKIKAFKRKMDYKAVGGAPLIGIMKPMIKAHGNSDERCFKNAIGTAKKYAESGIIEEISNAVAKGLSSEASNESDILQ